MLTAQEIHFNIVNELTLGSYSLRDYEQEELDAIINQEIYTVLNNINGKRVKDRTEVEDSIIRSLTRNYCTTSTKVDNIYTADLPDDYSSLIKGSVLVYDESCKTLVNSVEQGSVYKAKEPVLYNSTWYKPCEIFVGDNVSEVYGAVEKLSSKYQPSSYVDYNIFDTYNSSIKPIFTIEGDLIKIKSKLPVSQFCITYTGQFKNTDEIDICNGTTLNFPDNIQRFFIKQVVLKLAIIADDSQQKVINLKSENIK